MRPIRKNPTDKPRQIHARAKRTSERPTTAANKKLFLEHFSTCGVIGAAAKAAGIARQQVYVWQEHDEDFAVAFEQAKIAAVETLEQEAIRRAILGVERLKFGQGGRVIIDPDTGQPYREREYSDQLLMFMLKGAAPDKYVDRSKREVSGPNGQPIQIRSYTDLSDDDLDAAIEALSQTEG